MAIFMSQLDGTPIEEGKAGGFMVYRTALALPLLALLLGASPVQAAPINFDISACVTGDCGAFSLSGGGSILATLDVINGNDLLITLTNDLNADATNDDPFLTNLGFEYGSILEGLSFDSFQVLSGTVSTPTFTVDSSIRTFFIDFGFAFSQDGRNPQGRFQAMDPNEVVQIVVGTTGSVSLDAFTLGVAKVAGAGTNASSGPIVLVGDPVSAVPEPTSMMLMAMGLIGYGIRRRSS
jgi:PEP-CTERM motif